MVLALSPPRKIILWTPALVQTLLAIIGTVLVSVVALGQWQLAKQKSWREAAEGGAALVESLKEQLEHTREEIGTLNTEWVKERKYLQAQIETVQGEMALLQKDHNADHDRTELQISRLLRQNHILQNQLDRAEGRNATQHPDLNSSLDIRADTRPEHLDDEEP